MNTDRIALALSGLVTDRQIAPPPIPVVLPYKDDEPSPSEHLGYAEGQSFTIEYISAGGERSVRRITVWSIKANTGGIPLLLARCHERKADRTFRVDRIRSCIDYDGEVFEDVPRFLNENFGMSLSVASKRPSETERWSSIRMLIADDAVLLSAIGRVDLSLHPAETQEATKYLCALAERAAPALQSEEVEMVRRYVGRLRPDERSIARAVDKVAARDPLRIQETLLAAVRVMDADGRRHPAETALLNDLANELLGVEIV